MRSTPLHEASLSHGRRSSAVFEGGDVEPVEVCNVMGHDLATSDVRAAEWKEFQQMIATSARRLAQADALLDVVWKIPGVPEAVEESGVLTIEGDPAESLAQEIWGRLVARVRAQQPNGPSDARRLLRDLAGLLDTSTETIFRVSHSGYVSYAQSGTSALPNSTAA